MVDQVSDLNGDAIKAWDPTPDEYWVALADGRLVPPPPPCGCDYEWKSPGVLYGIREMKGWMRMNTAPDCTVGHG